ncbi:phosphatase PAP2 family protein [Guyparkeria hydrothermalis]|uniref:undecaprenyl-diphosphate phosphatase n=1 Tax=Guyparkeria halophila TaxID=47960 RepID=A0A6I6D347_9GAMM|nr:MULTISPECIES: phosphatase PAP2 family protein [Guyparkeria]MCL7750010.1 phosphatase PAP2 family protein [Guyparkeria hydrothermalis]QGT78617.1 phosphatase PAP2 family protein [Guyparkeria halophila]TKA89750.1 phosphatase PAP2 family protein [Guyparkeria sp. SB14A]
MSHQPQLARDPDTATQLVWAFVLTAAVLLAGVFVWPGARESLFHVFNALGGVEATQPFWAGINALADTWLTLGLLLPFVLWRPRLAILMLFAAIVATAITHTLKPGLDILRPPGVLGSDAFHLIGHSIRSEAFPSGHTVTAFTFAGLLILGLRPRWPWVALLLAVASIMGISRMVAGVHWPTDVLAGAIVGLVSVVAAVWLVDRWPAARHARWPVPVAVFVCAVCALGAPWVDVGYPQGVWANWLVALIGVAALFVGTLRYWPGRLGRSLDRRLGGIGRRGNW